MKKTSLFCDGRTLCEDVITLITVHVFRNIWLGLCCGQRRWMRSSDVEVQRVTSRWTESDNHIVSNISNMRLVTTRRRRSTQPTVPTVQTCTSSSSSSLTTRRRRCRPTRTVLRKTVHTTTRTGTLYAPCRATKTSSKESCCDASTAVVSLQQSLYVVRLHYSKLT